MLLVGSLFVNSADAFAASAEPESATTYHVIYHDQTGSIIQRIPFAKDYEFDEDYPPVFVELPNKNVAWNTKSDGTGTSYKKDDKYATDPTNDLDLYPVIKVGHFVRFESNGGTPIEYQFVLATEKAIEPKVPERTGYTFDKWYIDKACTAAYDFNKVVTEDMMLYAKWKPNDNVEYKIRIWRENPNHPNRTQSTITQGDYNLAKTIVRNGSVGGKVSFTTEDMSALDIQGVVNSNTSPDNFQLYFYDNQNDSYAWYLSQESIKDVNQTGGIRADGNTIVDIYLRCMYFSAILTDGGCLDGTEHSYKFNQRMNENVRNAMSRANISIGFEPLNTLINKTITEESYYNRTRLYNGVYDPSQPDARLYYRISDEGALVLSALNPITVYNNMTNKGKIVDNSTVVWDIYKVEKGNARFSRLVYYETIESALEGRETVRKQQKDFANADRNNFAASDVYTLLRPENQKCEKFGLGDYAGFTSYFKQIINTEKHKGESGYYASGEYTYGGQKVAVDGQPKEYSGFDYYLPEPYLLEHYLLRNKYTLSFITYTDKRYVAPIDVFYFDILSKFNDKVVYSEGGAQFPFTVGVTTYSDDQSVIWIFKGWYDNEQLLGDPIDFATTKRTMLASNLTLYAKWEPKTITATYDGNGGKVEGEDKIEKTQPSGRIPVRPADPEPPEGMYFYCWTIDGKYYDFKDPIVEDTQLMAVYYSKSNQNKVTYAVGRGSGQPPVDNNFYLLKANAEVLEAIGTMVPPTGEVFECWTDADGNKYNPGEDVIVKNNTLLTAQYTDGGARIEIRRKGLKEGESAIYEVFKGAETKAMMTVVLTRKAGEPANVSRTIAMLDPGTYTVKETSWSWAYNPDTAPEVNPTAGSSTGSNWAKGGVAYKQTTIFTFDGAAKDDKDIPKHAEGSKANIVNTLTITIDVQDWENGGRTHFKF